ncbi:unnamed protein product [Penicillium bialowiezense]
MEREDWPATKHITEMIREHSEFLDEKQHESMQDILLLANLSDEMKISQASPAEKHEWEKRATNADPEDGPAAKKIKGLIREHSDRMDKEQPDNEQSILGLASLSDEIKAARDLISTEEAAQIINAFQCIPGLEAHYGRMEQRIQNVSRKESDQMARSIYLEAYAHAQLSQDSPARRSMPLMRDGRGHDISTEENQPMSGVQPPQDA